MKRRSRKEVSATENGHDGSASQCGDKRLLAVKVASPGIVSLVLPIVLPFAVLAILLAANLSLREPRWHPGMSGTPVAHDSLDTERSAQ